MGPKYGRGIYLFIYVYLHCEERLSLNSTTLTTLSIIVIHMNPSKNNLPNPRRDSLGLTGHSHPSHFPISKMALLNPKWFHLKCYERGKYMKLYKWPPSIDFIQKMSQAPSKLDYLKNPSQIYFCLWFLSLRVQSCKITLQCDHSHYVYSLAQKVTLIHVDPGQRPGVQFASSRAQPLALTLQKIRC